MSYPDASRHNRRSAIPDFPPVCAARRRRRHRARGGSRRKMRRGRAPRGDETDDLGRRDAACASAARDPRTAPRRPKSVSTRPRPLDVPRSSGRWNSKNSLRGRRFASRRASVPEGRGGFIGERGPRCGGTPDPHDRRGGQHEASSDRAGSSAGFIARRGTGACRFGERFPMARNPAAFRNVAARSVSRQSGEAERSLSTAETIRCGQASVSGAPRCPAACSSRLTAPHHEEGSCVSRGFVSQRIRAAEFSPAEPGPPARLLGESLRQP